MSAPGADRRFEVLDLFADVRPEEAAREVLDYFSSVGAGQGGGRALAERDKVGGGLGNFDLTRTESILKNSKKVSSSVEGDPMPGLLRQFPRQFAGPVSIIYNAINEKADWPKKWKTEHLTIIPQNNNPADLSECRNISCTSVLSKILESQVLEKLRGELVPDLQQFGGSRGCGAEHLLIERWDRVLGAVEGGKHAAVMLGVDFEKAFNRMDHGVCLQQLRALGASEESISLVAAFLERRRMTIKIGSHKADPVPINIGSPQGSVLGCLLYCVATQTLTKELAVVPAPAGSTARTTGEAAVADRRVAPAPVPTDGVEVRYFPQDSEGEEDDAIFWERADSPEPEGVGGERAGGRAIESFQYIDDTTLFETAALAAATRHYTTTTPVETITDLAMEGALADLVNRSKERNMKINNKKTQLLVISPPNGCHTTASVKAPDGDVIQPVESLKIVGFTFGSDPGVGAHVTELRRKFRRRIWMIYHLRNAGLRGCNLYRMYCCYVRSVLEYCSPAFHSMLNAGQAAALEGLNRQAVRICFGYDTPVEEIMRERGIETLEARRIRRVDKFIAKVARNARFGPRWLKERPEGQYNLRNWRPIEEQPAATARMYKSPLFFIRRRANDLGLRATANTN